MRSSAVILAGGRSSRMGGVDKAFMRVGGVTVIERSIGVLQTIFDEIIVVTNAPQKYRDMTGVTLTTDQFVGRGPLAGLHAGLLQAKHPYCFLVACDMPFIRPEPIAHLQSLVCGYDAVVPFWDGDVEPLHAFYARRLWPVAEQLLRLNKSGLRDLLPLARVRYVREEELRLIPGVEESFRNVNTPADALRYAVEL